MNDDRSHSPGGARSEYSRPRHDAVVAWTFVAVQFALIGLLVFLPRGDDWPLPNWLDAVAAVASWAGIASMILAALALRRGLTAAPLPNAHARLRTNGAYRYARHPIYTGLLLFAVAQVAESRSLAAALAGTSLVVLINIKARWEEERLRDRFPQYADYARHTPRFVPGWPAD